MINKIYILQFLLIIPFLSFSQDFNFDKISSDLKKIKSKRTSSKKTFVESQTLNEVLLHDNPKQNIEYSTYYINEDLKTNNTFTNIDFEALALVNSLDEQNRLNSLNLNEQEKRVRLEIVKNPIKAFEYGKDNNFKLTKKFRKQFGLSKKVNYWYHKIPHKSLFTLLENTQYVYENISIDGIKTQLTIAVPISSEKIKEINPNYNIINIEENFRSKKKLGLDSISGLFFHKRELIRKTLGNLNVFQWTQVVENAKEKRILDYYTFVKEINENKLYFSLMVVFDGDSQKVNFEKLEGRKYYFKDFIEKTLSTINILN